VPGPRAVRPTCRPGRGGPRYLGLGESRGRVRLRRRRAVWHGAEGSSVPAPRLGVCPQKETCPGAGRVPAGVIGQSSPERVRNVDYARLVIAAGTA